MKSGYLNAGDGPAGPFSVVPRGEIIAHEPTVAVSKIATLVTQLGLVALDSLGVTCLQILDCALNEEAGVRAVEETITTCTVPNTD